MAWSGSEPPAAPAAPGGPAGPAAAAGRGAADCDDPVAIRHAGRDLLSLALMDSRNHLLRLLAAAPSAPALRLALGAGAWQDHWIVNHVQRQRGEACAADAPRLGGAEPRLAAWLADDGSGLDASAVRDYLAQTLETTLDLLAAATEDDAGLHFFRQALLHEDRLGEALQVAAQIGGPPARAEREPLWLPAQRWWLGSPRAGAGEPQGLVPHNERWAHPVAVPEFEIDAQAVSWARYGEFADDGGYDRREFWSDAGWAWVQAEGRRAPRHVEQLHGGVLVQRAAARPGALPGLQRAPAGQAAMHVSRHEAQAWCRWAGRRLPTEAEWELAAAGAGARGFVWGDVFEWVAGSARAWPEAGTAAPGALDAVPAVDGQAVNTQAIDRPTVHPRAADSKTVDGTGGHWGVLRGGSFASRRRWLHPKARRFAPPGQDRVFCGFRSCAL